MSRVNRLQSDAATTPAFDLYGSFEESLLLQAFAAPLTFERYVTAIPGQVAQKRTPSRLPLPLWIASTKTVRPLACISASAVNPFVRVPFHFSYESSVTEQSRFRFASLAYPTFGIFTQVSLFTCPLVGCSLNHGDLIAKLIVTDIIHESFHQ